MRSNIQLLKDHLKKYGIHSEKLNNDQVIELAEFVNDIEMTLGLSLVWPYDKIRLIE